MEKQQHKQKWKTTLFVLIGLTDRIGTVIAVIATDTADARNEEDIEMKGDTATDDTTDLEPITTAIIAAAETAEETAETVENGMIEKDAVN